MPKATKPAKRPQRRPTTARPPQPQAPVRRRAKAPAAAPASAPKGYAKPAKGSALNLLAAAVAKRPTGVAAPAKILPQQAKRQRPAKAPAAPAVDPFDITPSTAPGFQPGVYHGWLQLGPQYREGNHVCIAYKRTPDRVYTLLLGQPTQVHEWDPREFDRSMQPCTLHGAPYPLDRALSKLRSSYNGITDKALRIVRRLEAGRDVDEEHTLEDMLDMTPTKQATAVGSRRSGIRVKRQAMTKDERRALRKKRRAQRFAKMTPAQLAAHKAQRKQRRQERKERRRNNGQ